MQFIESSMLGVRAARLSFTSRHTETRVTLFPMVHVGEPDFYRATYDDALGHDVVLLEGVRSPVTARITRSYRWLVGSRGMAGLVVQPRMPADAGAGRLVHADLTGDEFEAEWKAVPLWQRWAIYVLAPLVGLRRRWSSSRSRLAKDMACDYEPSLSELLALTPETGALTQAVLHARDERLLERLRAELDSLPPRSIAVVYGAAHMRAVVRELTTRRAFSVADAQWRWLMTGR
jgi:hypothetical protein